MIREIDFPRFELPLEKYINLIYINKTSMEFNEKLVNVITFLRKYSSKIKEISYFSDILDEKSYFIKVLIDIDVSDLPIEDQELFYKIVSNNEEKTPF